MIGAFRCAAILFLASKVKAEVFATEAQSAPSGDSADWTDEEWTARRVHPRGDGKYAQSTEATGDRGAAWRIP